MERPFAYLGFAYLLGALTVFYTSEVISLVFLFAALALAGILRKRRSRRLLLSVAGFSAAVLLSLGVGALARQAYAPYDGQAATVKGEIIREIGADKNTYELRVTQVQGEAVRPFRVQLYAGRQLRFKPWDSIFGQMTFSTFEDSSGSSLYKSRMAEGLVLSAMSQGDVQVRAAGDVRGLFLVMQQGLQNAIDSLLSEDSAGLLSAMLLGRRERVDPGVYADFQLAGVNHILVISGMHMSVIAGCVLFLMRRLPLPRRLGLLLAMGMVLLYMAVTGFGKSVTRSGLMYLLLLLSNLLGEEADSLNSLGLSVLLIGLLNPYAAMDLGFLLSVSATAGVVVLSPKICRRMLSWFSGRAAGVVGVLAPALSVSLSAFLFITPVLLLFFGVVNPLSVPCSLLLSLPGSAFLVCGALMALVGLVSPALAAPLAIAVRLLAKGMAAVAGFAARAGGLLPGFSGEASALLFMGILLVLALCLGSGKRLKLLGAALCLIMLVTASAAPHMGQIQLIAEDTGDGMMVSLVKGHQAVVLSAQGRNRSWASYNLKRLGVKQIHTLHISHGDELWFGEKLAADFDVGHLLTRKEVPAIPGAVLYDREYRFSPFAGVQIQVDLYGKVITADIYGKKLVLLKEGASGRGISGDLAVVSGDSTKVNCRFTIIRTDAIIDSIAPGDYIVGLDEAFCAAFGADGSMRLRRLG